MKILISLLIILVSYASCSLLDYRLVLSQKYIAKECTAPGPFCETCQSLVACVEEPDGSWIKNNISTCKPPAYCVDGACTTDYDPFCWGTVNLTFPCQTVGIFPDPFYCSKFVLCVKEGSSGLKAYVSTCEPSGFGFSVSSDLCDVKLEGDDCPEPKNPEDYPVPLCQQAGDTGAIVGKPAMYYLCKERALNSNTNVLYPYLYLCPGDEIYQDYECTSEDITTTEAPTTSTFSSTTTD